MSEAKRKALESEIKKVSEDSKLDAEQKARQIELLKTEAELEEKNSAMTGVGLRYFAGLTRGKGSQVVKWLAFDDSDEASYPKTIEDFVSVVKPTKEDMLRFAVDGFNSAAYSAASDPIAEYVNPSWDDAVKAQFKLVVRNYHRAMNGLVSLEEVVKLIKPGIESAQAASK